MKSRKHYRQDGCHKGFIEGKRTGGKVKKAYMANFLKTETQNLSSAHSVEFIKGWQEGFADGVRGTINKMVEEEGMLKNKIFK